MNPPRDRNDETGPFAAPSPFCDRLVVGYETDPPVAFCLACGSRGLSLCVGAPLGGGVRVVYWLACSVCGAAGETTVLR